MEIDQKMRREMLEYGTIRLNYNETGASKLTDV